METIGTRMICDAKILGHNIGIFMTRIELLHE